MEFKYKPYKLGDDLLNLGGEHYLFRFKNNYGASVICKKGSFGFEEGLYELLPIYWDNGNYSHYSEPIGFLSVNEVNEALSKINEIKTSKII